jgi:hypothetical protein
VGTALAPQVVVRAQGTLKRTAPAVRERTLVATSAPAFRDGTQRANACRVLLGLVGASDRWTPTGPAPAARIALDGDAGPDARRILQACWAIWEGTSTLALNELLQLEPRHLEALGELLAAMARGPAAIDAWLARWEPLSASPRASLLHGSS